MFSFFKYFIMKLSDCNIYSSRNFKDQHSFFLSCTVVEIAAYSCFKQNGENPQNACKAVNKIDYLHIANVSKGKTIDKKQASYRCYLGHSLYVNDYINYR